MSTLSFFGLSKVKTKHFSDEGFSTVEMVDANGMKVVVFLEQPNHEMHARNIAGAISAAVVPAVPA